MIQILSIIASIIFEVLAILSIFTHNSYFYSIVIFMLLHAVSAFFISYALYIITGNRYKKDFKVFILFYLLFFLTLSAEFLAFLLFEILYKKKLIVRQDTFSINPEEEMEYEAIPMRKRLYGEGSVLFGLRFPEATPSLKHASLLYLIDKSPILSYQFVRERIYDTSEEIRLLSFSIISRMENDINYKISILKKYLENHQEKNNAEIYYKLAELYWEIVYMNISDKEFEGYNLEQAMIYIKMAINEKYKYFDSIFLLGRIYLKLKDKEQARKCFNESLSYKFIKNRVIPYIAELYYLEKDFIGAKRILLEVQSVPINNKFSNIIELWKS